MADISIIMEVLGKEDMVKAAKLTDTLKNKMNFLAASLQKGKLTSSQYTAAVNQLASKNKTLAGGYHVLLGQLMSYNAKNIQTTNAVNQQAAAVTRLGNAQVKAGNQTQQTGRKMSSTGVAVQQLGYQAGDFLVQVQSGTNAMVAFGQQATQLVGVLPMVHKQFGLSLGAAVGLSAALGIAIPLLTAIGGYLMRTRGEAKTFTKELEGLDKVVEGLSGSLDILGMSTKDLGDKYGVAADSVAAYAKIEATLRAVLAKKEIEDAVSTLGDLVSTYVALEKYGDEYGYTLGRIQEDFKATADGARLLEASLDAISTAKTFDEQSQAVSTLLSQLDSMNISLRDLPTPVAELLINYIKANRTIAEADELIAQLEAGIDGSTASSSALTTQLENARDTIREMSDAILDFHKNLASGGLDIKALEAELSALQGGASQAVASGEALRVQLMNSDISREVLSTGSDMEQAGWMASIEQQVQDQIRGDELRAQIAGLNKKDTGSKSTQTAEKETNLEKLREELTLMEELRGKTEEYQYVRNKLGEEYANVNYGVIKSLEEQYAAIQGLIDLDQERASLATSLASSIGDGFTAMVEGTMSVKDAFKSMAKDIIKQLWDVLVMQKLIGSVGVGGGVGATGVAGFIGGLLGFDGGGYTGSGARSGGMDGKGGFVAMLHPQETVVDHTKGQSSGGTTVQQTLNFNFNAMVMKALRRSLHRLHHRSHK